MLVAAAVGIGRRRAPLALIALIAVTALAALAPTSPARAGALPAGSSARRLSNLRTVSRWAYPSEEAPIHASPSVRSRTIARLRFLTGDGQAELYVALVAVRLPSGQSWIEIEVPGRPNGRAGWVPRGALETLHTVNGRLLIDQAALRATLFRGDRVIFSAPIGVGKASTVTPRGHFYVMEKLVTLDAPVYGPYALGTSAYAPTLSEWPGGGVVGIHGTNEPQLIPGRPSHGCIRMRNADIRRLWAKIALGTPIDIT